VFGGPGDDILYGGSGIDVFDCGPGQDIVYRSSPRESTTGCEVFLTEPTVVRRSLVILRCAGGRRESANCACPFGGPA
jgi:Ca2+-binding RTX toxin-like protein